MPLHWALTYQTSGTDDRPVGNVYNAAGNIDTFCYEGSKDVPIRHDGWRGSLTVGRIPVDALDQFERILAEIPITRHDPEWNCQNWVWYGLRELRQTGFAIDPDLNFARLKTQMLELLEAWENGDI